MLKNILQKLYSIDHIPSLPLIKFRVEELCQSHVQNKVVNIEKLLEYVVFEPSLTIEFLKIANTDSFGFNNKISSVEKALHILDNELMRLILMQHPVIPFLKEFDEIVRAEFLKLTKHSIEVRVVMKKLIEAIKNKKLLSHLTGSELLTAATLHDIGLIFLLIYFPKEYFEISDQIKKSHMVQSRWKQTKSLPDHSLLSGLLCQNWNLPRVITSAVTFHHCPWSSTATHKLGIELLYVADNLSPFYYEIFYESDIFTIEEHLIMKKQLLAIVEKLGIKIFDLARLRFAAAEKCEKIYNTFGI